MTIASSPGMQALAEIGRKLNENGCLQEIVARAEVFKASPVFEYIQRLNRLQIPEPLARMMELQQRIEYIANPFGIQRDR
jgi:hypothetical protein